MSSKGTTLLLVRHGQAELGTADADAERRLTLDGVAELKASCGGLGKSKLRLDRVLSSPLLRALETAQILSRELGDGREPVPLPELAPGAIADTLVTVLAPFEPGLTLAVVGHAPDLGGIIAQLVEPGRRHTVGFPPGGMACVAFPARPALRAGRLLWAKRPLELACFEEGAE